MTIFIKLGGSLITDKNTESSFRSENAVRLADEMQQARMQKPDLKLVIGHGSGSFGHFAASRYNTIAGVRTVEEWHGFADVARAATDLNHLITQVLWAAGLPVWRLQPSASAICQDGKLVEMAVEPVHTALNHGLVPLVHGDVALDRALGGTIISTETIFAYLARHLPVTTILLLGEVPGVLDDSGNTIPVITPSNVAKFQPVLGGSAGTDVTGGMFSKVMGMLDLTRSIPGLRIRILDGREAGVLESTLTGQAEPGTLIYTP